MARILRMRRLGVATLLALTVIFTGTTVWISTRDARTVEPPASQQLPWENIDGSLKFSGIPDTISLLDCGGNIVGTASNPFEVVHHASDAAGACGTLERRYNEAAENAPEEP